MPLDFLSLKKQIHDKAASAPEEMLRLDELRRKARQILKENTKKQDFLRAKVEQAAKLDSFLRCAVPQREDLDSAYPLPLVPDSATLIAADGSQIMPSRHEAVTYFLVNVGAIEMQLGSHKVPSTYVHSDLHIAEYSAQGTFTEEFVSLERDKEERTLLAELARKAQTSPIITLTDGPLELWGGRSRDREEESHFVESLNEYLRALETLHQLGAATAGYVDKPRADLVVRTLEIALTPQGELKDLRQKHSLRGVTDTDLFLPLLGSGQRSALFAIQSQLAPKYAGPLALHFFYLNVGTETNPWLVRVELPAWVAENDGLLDSLHASLVAQCKIMGKLSYPYVLHRAHELAVVSHEERQQLTRMILAELQVRGVGVGRVSFKQAAKELPGRTRR